MRADVDFPCYRKAPNYDPAPLFEAARKGKKDDLANIIKADGREVLQIRDEQEQQSALHMAAAGGHTESVSFLLKNKADVNAKDRINWTPLHSALSAGHVKTSEVLLKDGTFLVSPS